MFPYVLPFSGDVDARQASDSIKTVEIAWTRVHAIIKSGTCAKCNLSDGDQKAYLTPCGNTRDVIFINVKTARSRSDGQSEARFYSLHGDAWSVGFQSDGGEVSWKNSTIAVRSNRDRGAIEPRSWIFHRGITSTIIGRRSLKHQYHDRRAIVAQSWRDRGSFEVKLKLFHH